MGSSSGSYAGGIEAQLAKLDAEDVVGRVWRRDHTVWKPEPTEIEDRLGWLTVVADMRGEVSGLQAFAEEVRGAGYRNVVLLGMGGSSLGPEVLGRVFGSAEGYPELIVLDSTVPAVVRHVSEGIDPERTVFLVSSKSGSTIEPNCLYVHFREMVEEVRGQRAGESFVAVTDPGTILEGLASEAGFRRTFVNPPDIGGRYSVLSCFGLVPAALVGLDVGELLERADAMAQGCAGSLASGNHGAQLGVWMAELALRGRDKLTLVTSPSMASFGLWVEQLLAESTGKEGKGIVPVVGEPPMLPEEYGDDRQFVYVRLEGDENGEGDEFADAIAGSPHPILRLDLRDRYDLGAEFYRWEFAAAIAGAVLGIHPFDQPDVQAAKDMTDLMLAGLLATGELAVPRSEVLPEEVMAGVEPGAYVAILAYCRQTPGVDLELGVLRKRIGQRYGVATTVGYGPRYLHSTGQLHKGGPGSGVFLLLTADDGGDVRIPGRAYTFGQLAEAQALGDLQALKSVGRRVAWVRAGGDLLGGIRDLAARVG